MPTLDTLLRRDRAIVGAALLVTALAAWLYLFHLSATMPGMDMADMPGMAMPRYHAWGVVDVVLLFVMWAVMMSAMMVPAAVPQAGALPDPQLAFGLVNRMLPNFGADEPMTMNELRLTQMLPWPGKLGFGKRRAEHLARLQAFHDERIDVQARQPSRPSSFSSATRWSGRATPRRRLSRSGGCTRLASSPPP